MTADEGALNRQLQLLRVLAAQHIEIHRLRQPATVVIQVKPEAKPGAKDDSKPEPKPQTFATGSFVIRMDQPFSRTADALLDHQYWSPEDPQKHPYDDTGWSFSDLFNAKVVRVTDLSILTAKMEKVDGLGQSGEAVSGDGAVYAVNNSGQIGLAALVYSLKGADVSVAEEAFDGCGRRFQPGSLIIGGVDAGPLKKSLQQLDLVACSITAKPSVRSHAAAAPRIAFMHTWLYTQTEGWWRMAFDKLHVPYSYISTQTVSGEADFRSKYDVIVFAPVARTSSQQIINGLPMWRNPLPWQTTPLTPNLGKIDSTDDMRPGLGFSGLAHLKEFVEQGGLLITSEDTAKFAIDEGLAPGVFLAPPKNVKIVGTVLKAVVVGKNQPIAYGYDSDLAVYSADGMAFTVGDQTVNRPLLTEKEYKRPTGRGAADDQDIPEGRAAEQAPPLPSPKPWQPTPLNEEEARNNPYLIPPEYRPDVILRYADSKNLLLDGLLDNGGVIAELPVVVDAHLGKGNVLLFANNPVYRGETIGSYALVFNAILNYDHLVSAPSK